MPASKDEAHMLVRWPGAASRSDLAAAGLNKKFILLATSWGQETQRAKLSPTLFKTFDQARSVNKNAVLLSMQNSHMKLEMEPGKIWGDFLEDDALDALDMRPRPVM